MSHTQGEPVLCVLTNNLGKKLYTAGYPI